MKKAVVSIIFCSKTMNLNIKNAVAYLTFKELQKFEFVTHAFSTRLGGISENEFKSMNLSMNSDDNLTNCTKNFEIFANAVGFNPQTYVLTKQTHTNNIAIVTKKDIGNGLYKPQQFENIDGLVTNEPGVTLTSFHADCPGIFAVDPVKKAIGLAHAGWRGTVAKIAQNLINTMVKSFDSSPENIVCAISPSILKCCFEVNTPTKNEFENAGFLNISKIIYKKIDSNKNNKDETDSKFYIDLLEANKQLLILSGILEQKIHLSDLCTGCNHDLLFSYRKSGGKCGRLCSVIQIT